MTARRSPLLVSLFSAYVRRYAARHFHAVRLSRAVGAPADSHKPILVVLNHPSWWDPLTCIVLTQLFPNRTHYAPMEAAALARYRFFERLGFFGIEPGTVGGGIGFLRTSMAILAGPQNMLWVTAQGRFVDPRQRPLRLQAGVGRLAAHLSDGVILPLALEYPFWNERKAEALARFGEPLFTAPNRRRTPEEWITAIEQGLQDAQDALAKEACSRNPAAFDVLVSGGSGVGGVYDLWRSMRAWLRGERFRSEHQSGDDALNLKGEPCSD